MTFWIKSPLAILASGAENGLVIEADEFIELMGAGAEPATQMDKIFDATARFVLPGLINSYHHFYQTLTRFHPNAINKKLFLWLEKLYPIWECLEPEGAGWLSGCCLVDYLEQQGRLSDRIWLAHCIHFSDDVIARLGTAGTSIVHRPSSNYLLASGRCPAPALEAADAPVGLAVDGSASQDWSNLIQEVRQAV